MPLTASPFLSRTLKQVAVTAAVSFTAGSAFSADIWLYSGRDFTGAFSQASRSEPNLGLGGAQSVRISTGIWEICTQRSYGGECKRVGPGDYREVGDRRNSTIRSVRLVSASGSNWNQPGYNQGQIQIFESRDFRGRSQTIDRNTNSLNFNPGSAIVNGGTWEACTGRNFSDRCQALPPGQYRDLGSQLSYRIQSLRVLDNNSTRPPVVPSPGQNNANVTLFSDYNLGGEIRSIDGTVSDLRDISFNDRTRSIRVARGQWEVCDDINFGPPCMIIDVGNLPRLYPQFDGRISSIRPASNQNNYPGGGYPSGNSSTTAQIYPANGGQSAHDLWLFEDSDFRGSSLRSSQDIQDLSGSGMNDKISSIIINNGIWQFCSDADFRGNCYELRPGQYRDTPAGTNDSLSSFRRIR